MNLHECIQYFQRKLYTQIHTGNHQPQRYHTQYNAWIFSCMAVYSHAKTILLNAPHTGQTLIIFTCHISL